MKRASDPQGSRAAKAHNRRGEVRRMNKTYLSFDRLQGSALVLNRWFGRDLMPPAIRQLVEKAGTQFARAESVASGKGRTVSGRLPKD
jgi:hypothetical protein